MRFYRNLINTSINLSVGCTVGHSFTPFTSKFLYPTRLNIDPSPLIYNFQLFRLIKNISNPNKMASLNLRSESIISMIKNDHRTVESLFQQFQSTQKSDFKKQKQIVSDIIYELCVHAHTEEMLLYPAVRKYLTNGDSLADHSVKEHQEAKEDLYKLDMMDSTDSRYNEIVEKLISEVTHHVKEEETDILTKLQNEISIDDQKRLGEEWNKYKQIATTRPHPSVPSSKSGIIESIANAFSKPLDVARDAYRKSTEA